MKIQDFKQAHGTNYTKGRTKVIDHLVLHYVGAVSTAKNNLLYFQGFNRKASAHYFIDETGIYQSVLDTDTAWHAGDSSMNSRSIGIEMCCKKDSKGNWYIEPKTVDYTVELVKELMEKYNIDISKVIRHYDVTGKSCPEPWVRLPKEWDRFKVRLIEVSKEAVREVKVEEKVVYNTIEEVPSWGKETINKLVDKGYLKGSSGGLNLSEDMLRTLVILDRAKVFNNK